MARRLFVLSFPLAVVGALLLPATRQATAQSATFPAPVVASSTTTVGAGLNQPQSVAIDNAGNVFVANANAVTVIEFPASGGKPITVITAPMGSYNKGLTTDPAGNVYTSSYGGNIYEAPAGGGAQLTFYSSNAGPCAAALGYYFGVDDLSSDAASNIYAVGNQADILKLDQKGGCTAVLTPTQLGASIPSHVASDAAGDLYYSVGSAIYYLPVGSTSPKQVTTLPTVNGLKVDTQGDLFISDGGSIDEIPFLNGALVPSKLTYVLPIGPPDTVAVSPAGVIYFSNSNASSVQRAVIGSLPLGSSAVGTQGTAGVLTYTFNAAVTPSSFTYVSGSGASTEFATVAAAAGVTNTCATGTAYPASSSATPSSCTLNVALDAITPGKNTGAVLLNTSSATLATTYLYGVGSGAGLAVDPGTQTSLGTFTTPSAVRVDGAGNIFVADAGKSSVTEIPAGGGAAITVGSGLNAPQGLAVGPAGNLFIADTGNNRIVQVPISGGSLNTAGQTVVASGLSAPLGLALDNYGNVLIANSGAGNVLELPNQGGVAGLLPAFAVGTGFKKPTAIAVDANNHIFVADATSADVVEITAAGSQSTVLTNLAQLAAIAIDANDDIFLTQTGIAAVTRVAFTGGAYATNATTALGTGLAGPQGIALDSAGNLYVADAAGGAAYKIQRTLGALSFGKVNTGLSSAAQTLSLSNSGNQGLTLSSPIYTATGNSGDFSVAAAANNGCASALATGASCGVSATFSPTATGSRTATIAFASNAANAAVVGATLSGTGANSAPTTVALSVLPAGSISFGQTVTVTAAVAPVMTSTATPSGAVQFSLDGSAYGTPVPLSSNGSASEPITNLAGGAHVINATYSGDNNFASAAATSALNLTIAAATTVTTLASNLSGATAVTPGTSATFTATVKSSFTPPPYPSGSVSFFQAGNTTALGSAPLTNGVATFTSTTLPNGQYNVTAVYSGDTDFSTSTSTGFAVYVSPPTFVMSKAPTSLSVPASGAASTSFTLTPISGYTGTVFLSCSGLPIDAICIFTPGAVDFTVTRGPQAVLLAVRTGVAPSSAGLFAIPCLFVMGALLFSARRKRMPRLLMAAVLMACGAIASASLSGCSGGTNYASAAGTATVTVQLTGSAAPGGPNIVQSFSFALQVQ